MSIYDLNMFMAGEYLSIYKYQKTWKQRVQAVESRKRFNYPRLLVSAAAFQSQSNRLSLHNTPPCHLFTPSSTPGTATALKPTSIDKEIAPLAHIYDSAMGKIDSPPDPFQKNRKIALIAINRD